MSHHHLPTTISLFIMTLLSSTTLFCCVNAESNLPPNDFDPDCFDNTPNQETYADVDAYETLDEISPVAISAEIGWAATDDGICNNSFTACSNATDARFNSISFLFDDEFYASGLNDLLYIETSFSCTNCPSCSLKLMIVSIVTWVQLPVGTIAYNCTDGPQTETFIYNNSIDFDYGYPVFEAVFDENETEMQCITIERARLYQYMDCTDDVFNLPTYAPLDPGVGVSDGICVANAVSDSSPQAACSVFSEWVLVPGSDICQCSPGFEPNANFTACDLCDVDYHKAEIGNMACEMCPPQQVSTTNRTGCVCAEGYIGTNCMESSYAPRELIVSNVTNTSVVLSWLPPDDDGGRNISEIYYTVIAEGMNVGSVTVVLEEVTDTEVIVTGLTPGGRYIFSVTAENAVSSQDININDRTVNITATTHEGVAGIVSVITVSDDTVVSWLPPVPSNGIILYYNIRIIRADTGTIIKIIEELNVLTIDIADFIETNIKYNVSIQAVTAVGPGDYSLPVTVLIEQSSEDPHSSNSDVLTVLITSAVPAVVIVIIIIIITSVLIYIFCCNKKTRWSSSVAMYRVSSSHRERPIHLQLHKKTLPQLAAYNTTALQ